MGRSSIVYRNFECFGLGDDELELVENAEILVHAGAFTPKSHSDRNDILGCNGNITFTQNLLNLGWKNLKKIIYLSTIDVYGDYEGVISEESPTAPASLYGLSKLYCEKLVSEYSLIESIDCQILRVGHVYGPGEEKYQKVIPKAISSIIKNNYVEMSGDGSQLRSFIYVQDVADAIIQAVRSSESVEIINIVSANAISIKTLLERLIRIGGKKTRIVAREASSPSRNSVFDNNKLKHYLLSEEFDLYDGLNIEFNYMRQLNGET
jgi:UDP-glucose 4-epimerase